MSGENTQKVGYCSPPKHSHIKKGSSGNPNGRPRKQEDLYSVLARALNRKVAIKGHDERVHMRDALIHKLRELALAGDRRALDLQRQILAEAGGGEGDRYDPEETKRTVLKAFEHMGVKVNNDDQ